MRGGSGLTALALATFVCLGAGWLAMGLTTLIAPPEKAAAHILSGMGIRMGVPLLVCLFVTQNDPHMTEAGFAWYLIPAFLLGLAVETAMSVGQVKATEPK